MSHRVIKVGPENIEKLIDDQKNFEKGLRPLLNILSRGRPRWIYMLKKQSNNRQPIPTIGK